MCAQLRTNAAHWHTELFRHTGSSSPKLPHPLLDTYAQKSPVSPKLLSAHNSCSSPTVRTSDDCITLTKGNINQCPHTLKPVMISRFSVLHRCSLRYQPSIRHLSLRRPVLDAFFHPTARMIAPSQRVSINSSCLPADTFVRHTFTSTPTTSQQLTTPLSSTCIQWHADLLALTATSNSIPLSTNWPQPSYSNDVSPRKTAFMPCINSLAC